MKLEALLGVYVRFGLKVVPLETLESKTMSLDERFVTPATVMTVPSVSVKTVFWPFTVSVRSDAV